MPCSAGGVTNISETVAGLHSLGVVFARFDGMEQHASGVWTAPSGERHRLVHRPR